MSTRVSGLNEATDDSNIQLEFGRRTMMGIDRLGGYDATERLGTSSYWDGFITRLNYS